MSSYGAVDSATAGDELTGLRTGQEEGRGYRRRASSSSSSSSSYALTATLVAAAFFGGGLAWSGAPRAAFLIGWGGSGSSSGSSSASSLSNSSSSSAALPVGLRPSPEDGMGFPGIDRADGADPSPVWGPVRQPPFPTNAWYLNLVSHRAADAPDESTRAYTVPYVVDTAPALDGMAGIRLHWPVVQASPKNVQMVSDGHSGISLGTVDPAVAAGYVVDGDTDLSLLGVSLRWGGGRGTGTKGTKGMTTHIVRGMPYGTVRYHGGALPSLHSYNAPASPPLIDGGTELQCGVMDEGGGVAANTTAVARSEVLLHFRNSDFTWALFFSRPVELSCGVSEGDVQVAQFVLSVADTGGGGGGDGGEDDSEPLTVRAALLDQCTTGKSQLSQHCAEKAQWKDPDGYADLLREKASVFPVSPKLDIEYPEEGTPSEDRAVRLRIDWDPRSVSDDGASTGARRVRGSGEANELIMFALPHQQADLEEGATDHCVPTFHGSTCLVKGSSWALTEDVSDPISLTAARPPEAATIPDLAKALVKDIRYHMSDNLLIAAADTYFSGKTLARLARVIAITSEMRDLAQRPIAELRRVYGDADEADLAASMKASSASKLPSSEDIHKAVSKLKKAVEVWLQPDASAPFVFDRSWGGFVNCGCTYQGKGEHGFCNNTFPECPALDDVNEDFGNGFYNGEAHFVINEGH